MENPTLLALNISSLIIIIFSANLLILRSFERQAYLPLAIFLLAIGVVICQPTLASLATSLQPTILILSLPAILLIAPSLWFYVEGITAETPWQLRQMHKRHFVLFIVGAFVAFIALFVPYEVQYALLIEDNENILKSSTPNIRYMAVGTLIATLLLVFGWVLQSGFYFFKVVRRLTQYRQHLKDLFASTQVKEMRWLSWLLLAVGIVWSATAINIVIDNLIFSTQINATVAGVVILVMIWSVAIWGLRHKPGFVEVYNSDEDIQAVLEETITQPEKYQRSALNEQHASQIAKKIETAMQQDNLYLDASLSLQKLAKHISTSPNYISQTLNESIGMNFFDYVNKYRVEMAKHQLQHSSDTVIDIAMNVGFNAKSSFYTAFKKVAQQTPSQYRKSVVQG
ncbi:MAG: helix-turn-helix domain-containing protein [Colwellia sp.]|nr:helix-turn-helix domain-containing protein [Colwellia sp.]